MEIPKFYEDMALNLKLTEGYFNYINKRKCYFPLLKFEMDIMLFQFSNNMRKKSVILIKLDRG